MVFPNAACRLVVIKILFRLNQFTGLLFGLIRYHCFDPVVEAMNRPPSKVLDWHSYIFSH